MSEALDLFGTTVADLKATALTEVDSMVNEVEPDFVFAGFSGGNDSLATALIASKHPAFTGVFHANTGIGIQATRRFVRETALEQEWELFERFPPRMQYPDFVLKFGFPGPSMHSWTYRWLKEKTVNAFVQELKRKSRSTDFRVLLLTGVRSGESVRRMGTAKRLQREGSLVWGAPIMHWPNGTPKRYAFSQGVRTNQVNDDLHMSGECLCGAFAKPHELGLIEAFYPADGEYIRWLEGLARKRGVWASWDRPRPSSWTPRKSYEGMPELGDATGPMCVGCEVRRTA